MDSVSLDQLRTFLAAVDEGSFSAAARRLQRAQSVVSQTLANLETRLGIRLFDRSARVPTLTDEARALVDKARAVIRSVDGFQSHADELAGGLEAELSICVDVWFPMARLVEVLVAYRRAFPDTPLRLDIEALGATLQSLLDGRCSIAVTGSLPSTPPGFTAHQFTMVDMLFVASSEHPLAAFTGPIPDPELAKHLQLVLTDRSTITEGRDFGVYGAQTWRITDHHARLALIRAGLGWGAVPYAMVADDVAAGRLVPIEMNAAFPGRGMVPLFIVHRTGTPPGRAGRWLIEHLQSLDQRTAP